MSETKFTPGPWYVVGEDDWVTDGIDDQMICAQVGPEPQEDDLFITNIGPAVARVFAEEKVGAANLANAKLIAAAPDLYESLLTLVTLHAEECPTRNVEGALEECPAVVRALDVLAKARGEQP